MILRLSVYTKIKPLNNISDVRIEFIRAVISLQHVQHMKLKNHPLLPQRQMIPASAIFFAHYRTLQTNNLYSGTSPRLQGEIMQLKLLYTTNLIPHRIHLSISVGIVNAGKMLRSHWQLHLIGLKMRSWRWGSVRAKTLLSVRSAPQSFSITHSWCASVWYFILFVGLFCIVSSASRSGVRMGLVRNTSAGKQGHGMNVRCFFSVKRCGEPYFISFASALLFSAASV